jgi:hypothetical protein
MIAAQILRRNGTVFALTTKISALRASFIYCFAPAKIIIKLVIATLAQTILMIYFKIHTLHVLSDVGHSAALHPDVVSRSYKR